MARSIIPRAARRWGTKVGKSVYGLDYPVETDPDFEPRILTQMYGREAGGKEYARRGKRRKAHVTWLRKRAREYAREGNVEAAEKLLADYRPGGVMEHLAGMVDPQREFRLAMGERGPGVAPVAGPTPAARAQDVELGLQRTRPWRRRAPTTAAGLGRIAYQPPTLGLETEAIRPYPAAGEISPTAAAVSPRRERRAPPVPPDFAGEKFIPGGGPYVAPPRGRRPAPKIPPPEDIEAEYEPVAAPRPRRPRRYRAAGLTGTMYAGMLRQFQARPRETAAYHQAEARKYEARTGAIGARRWAESLERRKRAELAGKLRERGLMETGLTARQQARQQWMGPLMERELDVKVKIQDLQTEATRLDRDAEREQRQGNFDEAAKDRAASRDAKLEIARLQGTEAERQHKETLTARAQQHEQMLAAIKADPKSMLARTQVGQATQAQKTTARKETQRALQGSRWEDIPGTLVNIAQRYASVLTRSDIEGALRQYLGIPWYRTTPTSQMIQQYMAEFDRLMGGGAPRTPKAAAPARALTPRRPEASEMAFGGGEWPSAF